MQCALKKCEWAHREEKSGKAGRAVCLLRISDWCPNLKKRQLFELRARVQALSEDNNGSR